MQVGVFFSERRERKAKKNEMQLKRMIHQGTMQQTGITNLTKKSKSRKVSQHCTVFFTPLPATFTLSCSSAIIRASFGAMMKYDFKHDKLWKLKRNKAVVTHIEKLLYFVERCGPNHPGNCFENGVWT